MSDAPGTRTLLHTLACGALTFVLFTVAERTIPLALHPLTAPGRTALLLLALAAPALPLPGGEGPRRTAGAAALVACLATPFSHLAALSAIALAAGSLWLALAPRVFAPRAVPAGAALGAALLPLNEVLIARERALALWSAVAAALVLLALLRPWFAAQSAERRARGLRLRGLVAAGALLYLDFTLRRQLGSAGDARAVVAVLAGSAAALFVLLAPRPEPQDRRLLLAIVLPAAAAAVVAAATSGVEAWPLALRAALVLLVGRALVPAAARRPRFSVSVAWGVWLGCAAIGATAGHTVAIVVSSLVAVATLILLPRPARWRELAGRAAATTT